MKDWIVTILMGALLVGCSEHEEDMTRPEVPADTGFTVSAADSLLSRFASFENIAVKVMGVKSPYDTSNGNGWNYTGPDHRAVEVFGSWCGMVKKDANKVEIIFGCPNVPIP
jgi:hypothetical protein